MTRQQVYNTATALDGMFGEIGRARGYSQPNEEIFEEPTPEQMLWWAVIEQAILDFYQPKSGNLFSKGAIKKAQSEAITFIASEEFVMVLGHLVEDPDRLAHKIRAMLLTVQAPTPIFRKLRGPKNAIVSRLRARPMRRKTHLPTTVARKNRGY
jgi:hypothetical protein